MMLGKAIAILIIA